MKEIKLDIFPNSIQEPFIETSPFTPIYNCIAWAFGDNTKWYWPAPVNSCFWPKGIPREETLEAFIELYKLIDYDLCDNPDLEDGFEKIAIFQLDGKPTHAARQLPSGLWTSKLGESNDVSHSISSIEGGLYGIATTFMKRPIR